MGSAEFMNEIRRDVACPDCPSEVRVTEGARGFRARVIHVGTCPWLPRHLARERGFTGAVPCSTVVTHRGPYKRDPAGRRPA